MGSPRQTSEGYIYMNKWQKQKRVAGATINLLLAPKQNPLNIGPPLSQKRRYVDIILEAV